MTFHKQLLSFFWLFVLSINTQADDEQSQELENLQAQVATTTLEKGLLFLPSEQREVAFGAIDQLFPTRTITASTDPRPLVDAPLPLGELVYQVDQTEQTIDQLLDDRRVRGFLVLQGNRILLEHYAQGHGPDTRWISFSVTKSVTSMLIGAAIRDGFIDSVNDPVTRYLPRFIGTAYENVTVGQVLQMASGIKWNEDYDDPESDVAKAGGANGLTLLNYLSGLERSASPGERFNYNTAETNLAGKYCAPRLATTRQPTSSGPFGTLSAWLMTPPGYWENPTAVSSAAAASQPRCATMAGLVFSPSLSTWGQDPQRLIMHLCRRAPSRLVDTTDTDISGGSGETMYSPRSAFLGSIFTSIQRWI